MGPTEINGLPAHVLLVHVVVVLFPLACLALVLSTWWPAARRRLGIVTPILALVALIAVPITTHAGEWFRDQLGGSSELLERHEQLGNQLLPWAIVLFGVSALHWAWYRYSARVAARGRAVEPRPSAAAAGGGVATADRTETRVAASTATKVGNVVFAVVGLGVAVWTVYMVYRIGDSGAQAVWQGSVSN